MTEHFLTVTRRVRVRIGKRSSKSWLSDRLPVAFCANVFLIFCSCTSFNMRSFPFCRKEISLLMPTNRLMTVGFKSGYGCAHSILFSPFHSQGVKIYNWKKNSKAAAAFRVRTGSKEPDPQQMPTPDQRTGQPVWWVGTAWTIVLVKRRFRQQQDLLQRGIQRSKTDCTCQGMIPKQGWRRPKLTLRWTRGGDDCLSDFPWTGGPEVKHVKWWNSTIKKIDLIIDCKSWDLQCDRDDVNRRIEKRWFELSFQICELRFGWGSGQSLIHQKDQTHEVDRELRHDRKNCV